MELLLARNPEPDSSLPLLMLVPVDEGLVFRAKATWPRTAALYLHPVPRSDWPADPDVVERIPLRSCVRRGAAIDVVADRGRESRSQIVYTTGRGRDMVFWQAPRTRKQARPNVRVPKARASGLPELTIVVDAHERYPYRFTHQQVTIERRALPCGDYAVEHDGQLLASVERKSLDDLVGSVTSGRLRFALAELAALPRAAVVVEDRYSRVFTTEHVRPAQVLDGLAELQVRYPSVPIVFCETRPLAEEWTYRYLAAASTWLDDDPSVAARHERDPDAEPAGPPAAEPSTPSTRELRRWALEQGLPVSDRGRLRPEVLKAWQDVHGPADAGDESAFDRTESLRRTLEPDPVAIVREGRDDGFDRDRQ